MRGRFADFCIVWIGACWIGGCGRAMPPPTPSAGSPAEQVASTVAAAPAANWPDQWAAARLVDLTHSFDQSTIYWPTGEAFRLRNDAAGVTERGYYYSANSFAAPEHGGTHTDAPIHFYEDRATVDRIPLRHLVAPAAVVDVREVCAADRDYQIQISDLRNWEERQGRTLGDQIVLLRTGYAKHWPDRLKYLGTEKLGAEGVADLHFPGLAPEAAKWLIEQRMVRAVGIDTASIDHGQSRDFGSHVAFCGHNLPIFENVNLTDELPVQDFVIIALPMKIGGGSGGPTRIVAVFP
jgi:kynurenine formamidase